MTRKKQERLEFRYYEMPKGGYVLPLLGEKWKRRYGKDIDYLHFHNYMEIGYCYDGHGELILKDRKHPYFSNMFSVIPPNYPHNTVSMDDSLSTWEYLFVDVEGFLRDMYPERMHFAQEMVRQIYQTAHFLTYDCNPFLGNMIQEIIREFRYQEGYHKEKVKGLLLALLVEIARIAPDKNMYEGPDVNDQAKISNALHYVGKHYHEHVSAEMLADKCGLSETHFRRVFRNIMNMSPMEYVNLVRIQTACNLMVRTDATIEEIAMKTGFISMSTFNRNFKRMLDMSPHQWRRRPETYTGNLHRYHVPVGQGWE